MKAGSLFSGIGGFCDGFSKEGIPTAWAVDNDQRVALSYSANYSTVKFIDESVILLKDRTDELEEVDVLHAGFPCQSFSMAGERKGFEDERGQLFFHMMELINNMGVRKPKVLVLENSPYLQVGDRGAWFETIRSEIQKAGYWFKGLNAHILDPMEICDCPQTRPRLFMIAFNQEHFRSGRMTKIQGTPAPEKKLQEIIDYEGEKADRYYLPTNNKYYEMISSRRVSDAYALYQLRKYRVRVKYVCPTLTANMGLGGHNVPFVFDSRGLRKLTENECLKLQGFYDFEFPEEVPSASRYQQIGNAVNVSIARSLAKAIKSKIGE
jgi:DNA (cytosine-5)-methyltransferase 1